MSLLSRVDSTHRYIFQIPSKNNQIDFTLTNFVQMTFLGFRTNVNYYCRIVDFHCFSVQKFSSIYIWKEKMNKYLYYFTLVSIFIYT